MNGAPIPATVVDELRPHIVRLSMLLSALNCVHDFAEHKEIADRLLEASVELAEEVAEKWPRSGAVWNS